EEGIRLLRLAAQGGDGKAAYQLGALSLAGDTRHAPNAEEAALWWAMAAQAGHPLACRRLATLYRDGGEGLAADPQRAAQFDALATQHGL
ncbi:MAG TPA: sel1 repeat family protein, partial [Pseudomonas sp.]|nr:sel1 repeat family protein [Pseudomonas sp.]